MKLIIIGIFVALMALGTSCAQISQPVAEVAPQATSDGIQVHGDWTVTVTNPDGTVDAVHEFENELAQIGKGMLLELLAGDQRLYVTDTYPSGWGIKLATSDAGTELECEEGYSSSEDNILELSWTNSFPASLNKDMGSKTLQLWAVCTVKKVTGNVHVIDHVSTMPFVTMMNNDGTALPNAYFPIIPFTLHSLNDPIKVLSKTPAIMVNVEISFE